MAKFIVPLHDFGQFCRQYKNDPRIVSFKEETRKKLLYLFNQHIKEEGMQPIQSWFSSLNLLKEESQETLQFLLEDHSISTKNEEAPMLWFMQQCVTSDKQNVLSSPSALPRLIKGVRVGEHLINETMHHFKIRNA